MRRLQPKSRGRSATEPVRTCVGCRQRASVGKLLRVVVTDGCVVVDERRRLPGRGAWLHPDPECLSRAERRRAFSRALRARGSLDIGDVRQYVEQLAETGTRSSRTCWKEGSRSTRHESAVKLKP